jgi:hypothetical protein
MSAWRARALEFFPDMRTEIEGADSVGMLWIELCFRFERHYREHCACKIIHAIYLYATWCTRSPSANVYNGAAIGFYEQVARFAFSCDSLTYELVIRDLVSNIGLPEILHTPFGYAIESHQYEKFLADCESMDRDVRRDKKHNKTRHKRILR